MLKILVLALEIVHKESSQIGLEINWSKTKLQVFDDTSCNSSFQGISQCRTVVLHCCKGDAASQWEMAILGCQNSVIPEPID